MFAGLGHEAMIGLKESPNWQMMVGGRWKEGTAATEQRLVADPVEQQEHDAEPDALQHGCKTTTRTKRESSVASRVLPQGRRRTQGRKQGRHTEVAPRLQVHEVGG